MKRRNAICILFVLFLFLTFSVFGGGQSSSAASGPDAARLTNFNATGYPVVNEPVTLTVAVSKHASQLRPTSEFLYMQEVERRTNINIEYLDWEAAQVSERRRLAFATNQLPDVFFMAIGNLVNFYANNGQLTPLNDLIMNYAPDIRAKLEMYPEVIPVMTNPDDGKWYSLVNLQDAMYETLSSPDLFINKTWLDRLGIPLPRTTTDFHNALRAFKGMGPDVVPFAFSYMEGAPEYVDNSSLGHMFSPFGIPEHNMHMMIENGRLIYTFTHPRFREGVRWIAEMYREGLIDPESFVYSRQQLFAMGQTRDLGAALAYHSDGVWGARKGAEFEFVELYLRGPNGEQPVYYRTDIVGGPGTGPSITSACRYPEVAIRWINEFLIDEINVQQQYGNLGMYLIPSTTPPFRYDFQDPPPPGYTSSEFRRVLSDALGFTFYRPANQVTLTPGRAVKKASDDYKMPYFPQEYLPQFIYTEAELQEVQPMATELDTFVMTTLAQWITRGTVDAEWDNVQAQLNRMRLPRYMEIHQRVYDRMMEARRRY